MDKPGYFQYPEFPYVFSLNSTECRIQCIEKKSGRVRARKKLKVEEYSAFCALLEDPRQFCTYETMLSSIEDISPSEAHTRIESARDEKGNVAMYAVKDMRCVISSCRKKLRRMGIDIGAVYQTGYILLPEGETHEPHYTHE